MEYLKEEFHRELASEGNFYIIDGRLYIREHHWAPEDLLQAISDEIFTGTFNSWLEERAESLISKADEILAKCDQVDRFARLQQAYRRGVVTPFVGAGMCCESGYPLWTQFLRGLRRQTGIKEEEFEHLLSNGQYEEAAQSLADFLNASFNEELENAFGRSRPIMGAIQYLPYAFDAPVITTNYDDVLKRCYENALLPFEETVSGHLGDALPKFLGVGQRVLVKLHGTALTGSGRILTLREYQQHYENHGVIKKVIKTFSSRTLLFLGCSLSVDRTIKAMADFACENGHDNVPRHYAFLEEPESEKVRIEKRQLLSQSNIYPIWYPQGEHDESIEALLVKLKEG